MESQYRILNPLEPGPDCAVYLVSDLWNARLKKVLTLFPKNRDCAQEQLEEGFFQRRALDHPLLPDIHDIAFRGARPGMVSQYLPGPSLERRNSPLGMASLQNIAAHLAELLHFLHCRDFVAGHLTPSKLFLGKDGLKVTLYWPDGREPQGNSIRYSAPELISESEYSNQGDIYSLGMLYYFLFTGKHPFSEHDPETLRKKQLVAYPPNPRKINSDIPSRIEGLILSQIQKDPERRPNLPEIISTLEESPLESGFPPPRFRSIMIGRKTETRVFRDLCQDFLEHPQSRFVLVGGVSGIGKTFLAEHLETTAKLMGIQTASVQHRTTDTSGEAFRELRPPSSSVPQSTSDPSSFVQSTVQIVQQYCRDTPFLLHTKGTNCIDEVSLDIYRRVMACSTAKVLLLGDLSSSGCSNSWEVLRSQMARSDRLTEFELRPLSKSEILLLLNELTISEMSEDLATYLMGYCGGMPLYTLHTLSHMACNKRLVFETGRWIWKSPVPGQNVHLPEITKQALISRLSQFGRRQREILDHLALLGFFASIQLLRRLINAPLDEIIHHAKFLAGEHLIDIRGGLTRPELRLRYGMLKTTLTSQLPRPKKKRMHRSIAVALQEENSDAIDPELKVHLVRQLLEGGATTFAKSLLPVAIAHLRALNRFREASSLIRMADDAGAISLSKGDFLKDHVESLYLSGQLGECMRTVRKAIHESCDGKERTLLLSLLGKIQISRGHNAEGLSILQQALSTLNTASTSGVTGDIWGDLLSHFSCTGKSSSARQIAAQLLRKIARKPSPEIQDKLYHAVFLYYCFAEGQLSDEAVKWERKSVHQALRTGNLVRAIGRIFNIALASLRAGQWDSGRRLTDYCQAAAKEIGNTELDSYVKTNCLVELRKKGQHNAAQAGLRRQLNQSSKSDHNLHLHSEWCIETAKNAVYRMEPEEALTEIERLESLPQIEHFTSTVLDAGILKGWTSILLGRPMEALEIAEKLRDRGDGRVWLLSGQAHIALGDLETALEDSKAALRYFPKSVPYYRVRTRLLQAEILTSVTYLGEAGPYITDALQTSKERFYFPLLARAYMFKGKWLAQKGNPAHGRTHCLRALQVARKVERPGLRAEILRTLGTIEAGRSRREVAHEYFEQAIQILRDRCLRLSLRYRPQFADAHIKPIETELAALTKSVTKYPPRSLIHSRDLTRTLIFTQPPGLSSALMASVRKVSPLISANLFLRSESGNSFHLAARCGKCRQSGRHSLPMLQRNHPAESRVVTNKTGYALMVPLNTRRRLEGFLYVERGGGGISELGFDSLTSIAYTGGLYLQGQTDLSGRETAFANSEVLAGDKRIVGSAPCLLRMLAEIDKVAPARATVLVEGETGTGKELVARAIHERSGRLKSRFKPLNCSAIPDNLVESELFGHVRGAFTGATQNKMGLFEAASGGTLFLDEISTLPLSLQNRLLRVLEEKKIRRVGDTEELRVNTRVVAATNENLLNLVREGQFRSDLYHRLNVFRIEVPPLRRRLSDLQELCGYFLDRLSSEHGKAVSIADEALGLLKTHSFPGNVRELKNLLQNLFLMNESGLITAKDVHSRVFDDKLHGRHTGTDQLQRLLDRLVSGSGDFWVIVRDPFLHRDLSRREVRWIVAAGLETCNGSYRKLVGHFGMEAKDYKRFLAFLTNHNCKVDFRPYRQRYGPLKRRNQTRNQDGRSAAVQTRFNKSGSS